MARCRRGGTHGFLDNGAFSDWRAGRPFDEIAFARDLARARECAVPPDFIVAPDIVAGGASSLALSLRWLPAVSAVGPAYLAVQDGMSEADVDAALPGYAGVFVGGTLRWKLETGGQWTAFARARGIGCHVGRVGNMARVAWALRIGATSIDSSQPLWSSENLERFGRALQARQMHLGW